MSESTPNPLPSRARERSPLADIVYWLLAVVILAYVALCTGNRDVIPDADAWEHHRVIVALTAELWHPGNPTFAIDNASIRYSPYFIAQAALCRATGFDPFAVLSMAAVANTALFMIGLWSVLCAWGERRIAPLALLTIVGLWGVAPGYAGTTALSDLPWHQVNPSAFSFATFLLAWASLKRFLNHGGAWRWIGIAVVCVLAMLDHAMTGAFAVMALFITALLDSRRRWHAAGGVMACSVVALGVCLAWPLYPFMEALVSRKDVDYWFNGAISRMMLTQWCAPAIALALAAMLRVDRPLVKTCLAIGAAGLFLSIASIPVRSPTFARFAMPANVMFQIAIAVWACRSGLMCPKKSLAAISKLYRVPTSPENASTVLHLLFVLTLLYGLIPQLIAVLKEPHLARPTLARFLHIRELAPHLKPIYDELLSGIGPKDVVLGTPLTSWPVPSSRGRIVAALHYERFVDDQVTRDHDSLAFFDPGTSESERNRILTKYAVRWIILDTSRDSADVQKALSARYPLVRQSGTFVLLGVQSPAP